MTRLAIIAVIEPLRRPGINIFRLSGPERAPEVGSGAQPRITHHESLLALGAFLLSVFYFLLCLGGGFGVALGWLWGRIEVALGWL
jgi:hypothetical protein